MLTQDEVHMDVYALNKTSSQDNPPIMRIEPLRPTHSLSIHIQVHLQIFTAILCPNI